MNPDDTLQSKPPTSTLKSKMYYTTILKELGETPHAKLTKRGPVLEPLDQASWDKLEGKARWDSIVALRGPDLIHSDTLKWFTTSVIRFRLSKVMRVGGLVNNSLGFVVLPADTYAIKTDKFDASHFINHVREAAGWLGIPVIYTSQGVLTKMLDGAGKSKALAALYEELSEGPFKAHVGALLGKEGNESCQE